MATRREISELIQRRFAGGTPSQDFEPTLDEINKWLDYGVASAAMKNYADGVNIDGIEFVGDAFYTTVKNLVLTTDDGTPYYKTTLPSQPVSLPRGYDIASVQVMNGNKVSKSGIRVSPQQLDYYKSLPKPDGFFYWTEQQTLFVDSDLVMTGKKLLVRMASSAVDRSLDAALTIPDDQMAFLLDFMFRYFGNKVPQDYSNDGKNIV